MRALASENCRSVVVVLSSGSLRKLAELVRSRVFGGQKQLRIIVAEFFV
jgi:hypothetical protein